MKYTYIYFEKNWNVINNIENLNFLFIYISIYLEKYSFLIFCQFYKDISIFDIIFKGKSGNIMKKFGKII